MDLFTFNVFKIILPTYFLNKYLGILELFPQVHVSNIFILTCFRKLLKAIWIFLKKGYPNFLSKQPIVEELY